MNPERPEWMEAGDLKFLDYLQKHEGELIGPATIAKNTQRTNGKPYNRDYVWRRIQDLVDAGLVEKVDRGEYTITELGIDFLEGDVDKADLEVNDGRGD